MNEAHSPHLSSHLGVPARTSNQLTEVTVGFADPPHSRRISKLSRNYWCDKHQQRAARKRPSAVRESPPPPAKARAKIALMHEASASAPQYHNVASVAAASATMEAANAAGLAGVAHAVYGSESCRFLHATQAFNIHCCLPAICIDISDFAG